jgi:hypothetical protein
MISTKVFITTSAFTLALAGAVIGNKAESPITRYAGYNLAGRCVLTDPPFERSCGPLFVYNTCTVFASPGTDDENFSDAWLSLTLAPACLLPLRREEP